MQPVLAEKSVVAVPGALEGDLTAAREALRRSLRKHGQEEDVWGLFSIIFISPPPPPSPLQKREELRL